MKRLIFAVSFMTAFRHAEMYSLKMVDLTIDKTGSKPVIHIAGSIGGDDGESKNNKGVFHHVPYIPKEIFYLA